MLRASALLSAGYDMHHDLDYPLMTQTIATDGKFFMFVTYQLNTIELFKGDIDNKLYNAYSASEPYQLYGGIQDGKASEYSGREF